VERLSHSGPRSHVGRAVAIGTEIIAGPIAMGWLGGGLAQLGRLKLGVVRSAVRQQRRRCYPTRARAGISFWAL
jgi:hypothetical protein